MFMGEYEHILDAKGRMIVPSKFREALGDRFVVTRGLDGCLFVYDEGEWNRFEGQLSALPLNRKDNRVFVRHFLAGAAEVEVDRQGRVLLPARLREFAGLEKDVVLVGAANHIEIWSRDLWENQKGEEGSMEEIAERMAELGLRM